MKHLSHIDATSPASGTYAVMTDRTVYELLWLDIDDGGVTETVARNMGAVPLHELVPENEIAAKYLEAYAVAID